MKKLRYKIRYYFHKAVVSIVHFFFKWKSFDQFETEGKSQALKWNVKIIELFFWAFLKGDYKAYGFQIVRRKHLARNIKIKK